MIDKAHILVMDDEDAILELIQSALSRAGYRVTCAHDGAEGVEKFAAGKFELVLTDIQMPGMDGITALGEIKKLDPGIEVIIATGHGTMSTAIQSLRKGAFDYLHKPFQIKDLLTVVAKALEKRKFNEITKAIFSTIKPEELLRVTLDSVTSILKAEESLLALPDKDGRLKVAVSEGLEDSARLSSRLELCGRMMARLDGEAKSILLVDEPAKDKTFVDLPGIGEIKCALFLPLMEENKPAGLININRTQEGEFFTEEDLQRAKVFGSLVNLALRNSNLYRQLQETQSQLIQAEKMSALGQLAGGLAHEINNPLSGILGLTQLVLENTEPASQNHTDLKDIEKAVFRCKKIIVSLLSFARQEKTRVEPVSLNEVIEETLTLCARQMELKSVRITRQYAQGLPMINGDSQQLMQVFLNLFTNARDAMPEGGELTMETSLLKDPSGKELITAAVSDTGAGIKPEILDRVFDPFFTTKPVGKGTGLGLSVCLGIISRHSGTIKASGRPGGGSTFTISLPT